MKLQVLASAALVLLSAIPSALSEETSHAVAKPIEKFEDVLESITGLYEEEDSYDMDMLVKKDDDPKSKKTKKSKKSNKKKSKRSSNKRKKSKRRYKHYKNGMCGRKMRKKDRKLCRELERDFCSRKSRRKRNRSFCRHLGFPRDESLVMVSDDEDELPQEYQVLIEEVAKNIVEEEYEEEDIVYIKSDTDTDRVDWDKAKNKTKNAARRTADGAKKAADKTAEGSKKAWDKTKDWGRRTFTNSGFSTTKSSSVAVAGAVVLAMFI